MIRCIGIYTMHRMVAHLPPLVLRGVAQETPLLAGSSAVEHGASIARGSLSCRCAQLLGVGVRWVEQSSSTRSRNCDLVCMRSIACL